MYVQKCQVILNIELVGRRQIFKACTYHKVCSQIFSKCWWPSDFTASARTENSSTKKKKKKEKGLEPLDISKQTSDTLEPFSGNSVKIWLPGIYSI